MWVPFSVVVRLFEDEFRHVCRVEVSIAVEAAACCEGFEVELQLANVFK